MDMTFAFVSEQDTIRLFPNNLLIVERRNERWCLAIDTAVREPLATRIFRIMHQHKNRIEPSATELVKRLNACLLPNANGEIGPLEAWTFAEVSVIQAGHDFFFDMILEESHDRFFCGISRKIAFDFVNNQMVKMCKYFELPEGTVMNLPLKPGQKHRPKKKSAKAKGKSKFSNTKKSFEKFVSTKSLISPAEFEKIFDHGNGPEYYTSVEAILLYYDNMHIFQLKMEKSWEYDFDKALVTSRYCYLNSDNEMIQNDYLPTLERELFNDYLDNY